MFKNYIKTILEYKKDNNNLLTQRLMKTLENDLRRDITDAFEIAEPFIVQHSDLYANSSSFLDFLFKIMNMDLPPSTVAPPTVAPPPPFIQNENNIMEKLQNLPQSIDSLQQLLIQIKDDCKHNNKTFINSIEETMKQHLEHLISSKMCELNVHLKTQQEDIHKRNKTLIEKIESTLQQMTTTNKINHQDLDSIQQNISSIKNIIRDNQSTYEKNMTQSFENNESQFRKIIKNFIQNLNDLIDTKQLELKNTIQNTFTSVAVPPPPPPLPPPSLPNPTSFQSLDYQNIMTRIEENIKQHVSSTFNQMKTLSLQNVQQDTTEKSLQNIKHILLEIMDSKDEMNREYLKNIQQHISQIKGTLAAAAHPPISYENVIQHFDKTICSLLEHLSGMLHTQNTELQKMLSNFTTTPAIESSTTNVQPTIEYSQENNESLQDNNTTLAITYTLDLEKKEHEINDLQEKYRNLSNKMDEEKIKYQTELSKLKKTLKERDYLFEQQRDDIQAKTLEIEELKQSLVEKSKQTRSELTRKSEELEKCLNEKDSLTDTNQQLNQNLLKLQQDLDELKNSTGFMQQEHDKHLQSLLEKSKQTQSELNRKSKEFEKCLNEKAILTGANQQLNENLLKLQQDLQNTSVLMQQEHNKHLLEKDRIIHELEQKIQLNEYKGDEKMINTTQMQLLMEQNKNFHGEIFQLKEEINKLQLLNDTFQNEDTNKRTQLQEILKSKEHLDNELKALQAEHKKLLNENKEQSDKLKNDIEINQSQYTKLQKEYHHLQRQLDTITEEYEDQKETIETITKENEEYTKKLIQENTNYSKLYSYAEKCLHFEKEVKHFFNQTFSISLDDETFLSSIKDKINNLIEEKSNLNVFILSQFDKIKESIPDIELPTREHFEFADIVISKIKRIENECEKLKKDMKDEFEKLKIFNPVFTFDDISDFSKTIILHITDILEINQQLKENHGNFQMIVQFVKSLETLLNISNPNINDPNMNLLYNKLTTMTKVITDLVNFIITIQKVFEPNAHTLNVDVLPNIIQSLNNIFSNLETKTQQHETLLKNYASLMDSMIKKPENRYIFTENETSNCTICQDIIKTGSEIIRFHCQHKFHDECVKQCFNHTGSECPLCRQILIPISTQTQTNTQSSHTDLSSIHVETQTSQAELTPVETELKITQSSETQTEVQQQPLPLLRRERSRSYENHMQITPSSTKRKHNESSTSTCNDDIDYGKRVKGSIQDEITETEKTSEYIECSRKANIYIQDEKDEVIEELNRKLSKLNDEKCHLTNENESLKEKMLKLRDKLYEKKLHEKGTKIQDLKDQSISKRYKNIDKKYNDLEIQLEDCLKYKDLYQKQNQDLKNQLQQQTNKSTQEQMYDDYVTEMTHLQDENKKLLHERDRLIDEKEELRNLLHISPDTTSMHVEESDNIKIETLIHVLYKAHFKQLYDIMKNNIKYESKLIKLAENMQKRISQLPKGQLLTIHLLDFFKQYINVMTGTLKDFNEPWEIQIDKDVETFLEYTMEETHRMIKNLFKDDKDEDL